MAKYFITVYDGSAPAILKDAKEVARKLEGYATVKHMGDGFCVESPVKRSDLNAILRSEDSLDVEYKLIPAEMVNVKITIDREHADAIMSVFRAWGGNINYVSECYENTYIDADILKSLNNTVFHY